MTREGGRRPISSRAAVSGPIPRDGSLILSDVRGSTLAVLCAACRRRGRYRVESLMASMGTRS
jgi:hypothetical protein